LAAGVLDHFHIDTDLRMVFSTFKGILTEADMRAEWDQLRASPDFDSKYWQLIDFTEVTKIGVSVGFMRFLGSSKPMFDVSSRRAIVVDSDEAFAMMRLAVTHVDGAAGEIRLFRDMAEARGWLDLAENSEEL
jgi:hypothetical protein